MLEFPFCDPGEARTLDPMIKSHLLYQLSYGVSSLFVSGAKVIRIFESTSISAEKIDFVCYFLLFWRLEAFCLVYASSRQYIPIQVCYQ